MIFSLKSFLFHIEKKKEKQSTQEGLPHWRKTWKKPRAKLKAVILARSSLASLCYY